MKKTFKYLGFTIMLILSFFYTEKASTMMKEADQIMYKLRDDKKILDKQPIEAVITKNTIVPGIAGSIIDVEESYKRMKKTGSYNSKDLVYKKVLPNNTLIKNMNKAIISGNKEKNNVSIILILDDERYINFVEKNDENVNIFVDLQVLKKIFYEGINLKNILGTIGDNFKYEKYYEINKLLKGVSNYKRLYCLTIDINEKTHCDKYNNFTIYSDVVKTNQLFKTKEKLQKGEILIYEINDNLISDFSLILELINSKGYNIVNLNDLLKE
jgi:hypothetical protein